MRRHSFDSRRMRVFSGTLTDGTERNPAKVQVELPTLTAGASVLRLAQPMVN